MRGNALKALDGAGIAWAEVFVGGGIGTVGAAVMAGLAVAPMTRRGCPPQAVDVGNRLGLQVLAPVDIAMCARLRDAGLRERYAAWEPRCGPRTCPYLKFYDSTKAR